MSEILAEAIGINPRLMPRDAEMSRLFEARRADDGEAWSQHKRKLSGLDLVFSPHKSVSLAAEFAATPQASARYLVPPGTAPAPPSHLAPRPVRPSTRSSALHRIAAPVS